MDNNRSINRVSCECSGELIFFMFKLIESTLSRLVLASLLVLTLVVWNHVVQLVTIGMELDVGESCVIYCLILISSFQI